MLSLALTGVLLLLLCVLSDINDRAFQQAAETSGAVRDPLFRRLRLELYRKRECGCFVTTGQAAAASYTLG